MSCFKSNKKKKFVFGKNGLNLPYSLRLLTLSLQDHT